MSASHHAHGWFDPYSRIRGPIQDLPAWLKVFVALGLVLSVLLVPVRASTLVTFYPAVLTILAATCGMSFLPLGFVLKRLALTEPVVLGAAAMALFQPGGLVIFLTLLLRTTLCICIAVLLANTTPFSDLLDVMRALRMPAVLLSTLALMYRYLFVLTTESQRMQRARASRMFDSGRRLRWRLLAGTVAHLFVRATGRAERIYLAMCARGWR